MELIKLKCPSCNGNVEVEEGKEYAVCQYCGTSIKVHDNTKHTVRIIDEAKIIQAETEQAIRFDELEQKAEQREIEKKNKKIRTVLLVLAWVFFLPITAMYFLWKSKNIKVVGKIVLTIVLINVGLFVIGTIGIALDDAKEVSFAKEVQKVCKEYDINLTSVSGGSSGAYVKVKIDSEDAEQIPEKADIIIDVYKEFDYDYMTISFYNENDDELMDYSVDENGIIKYTTDYSILYTDKCVNFVNQVVELCKNNDMRYKDMYIGYDNAFSIYIEVKTNKKAIIDPVQNSIIELFKENDFGKLRLSFNDAEYKDIRRVTVDEYGYIEYSVDETK